MILNGKSRIEFEKWLSKQQNFILNRYTKKIVFMGKLLVEDLPDEIINALIINWFDSVGIYIGIEVYYLQEKFEWVIPTNDGYYHQKDFKTRQEATEKAIEKANLIFNSYE